jgi:hypothetical protein
MLMIFLFLVGTLSRVNTTGVFELRIQNRSRQTIATSRYGMPYEISPLTERDTKFPTWRAMLFRACES